MYELMQFGHFFCVALHTFALCKSVISVVNICYLVIFEGCETFLMLFGRTAIDFFFVRSSVYHNFRMKIGTILLNNV